MSPLSRRRFLQGSALLCAAPYLGCTGSRDLRPISGAIVGAPAAAGHLLRDGNFPTPSVSREVETAIIGGGIAGLSAAWWFRRSGNKDFTLLELAPEAGGNAASGRNSISAYPWGAHYVPIPNRESSYVITLFEELGVIEGRSADGTPRYNELYLCAAPQERLFIDGKWQDGLLPAGAATADDHRQYERFFDLMNEFRSAMGEDGRRAFAIPLELSSRDPRYTELDALSFTAFLGREGFTSEPLHWYLNYCCRDDYGCDFSRVSAWAGIHYFAGRDGWSANSGPQEELTWPEGNGWLVQRLRERCAEQLTTNALAFDIRRDGDGFAVQYLDMVSGAVTALRCRALIYAAPRFTAPYLFADLRGRRPAYLDAFEYSPWMVANLSLTAPPDGPGSDTAWDNVIYGNRSLGYVSATHQELAPRRERVLTYYLPLSWAPARAMREEALAKSHADWCRMVLDDLFIPHPRIAQQLTQIDVWLWGHGMIQPQPGFIWGQARAAATAVAPPLFFAHSDMSGISIFEEAQYRGVTAADQALSYLGRRPAGSVTA